MPSERFVCVARMNVVCYLRYSLVKAKFHYAIQLANRELVCDLLASWIA